LFYRYHALKFSSCDVAICVGHFAVVFGDDDVVFIIIGAHNALGVLFLADGDVHLGEDSLVDAAVCESSLNYLNEWRAVAEFDLAASAELLSIFEESFV